MAIRRPRRRRVPPPHERKGPFRGANDVFKFVSAQRRDEMKEYFYALYLDTKSKLLAYDVVSIGTLSASLVHPREVFRPAIDLASASIIVAHNHPSGDTTPSREDYEITERLQKSGTLIGIKVIDHVIFAPNAMPKTYISLAERDRMFTGQEGSTKICST